MPIETAITGAPEEFTVPAQTGRRWGVVLAGGEGIRMRSLIKSWLGENRPKQYCTFSGSRSMLQHTLDRAAALLGPDQIMTIIGTGHGTYLKDSVSQCPGCIIEQPANRGTAPGVLLPISFILDQDPEATVLILPSDHFVYPEDRFNRYASEAVALAERNPDRLVLMGAIPDGPETDYGWIEPGPGSVQGTAGKFAEVRSFLEKPSRDAAQTLYENRWLWNTMIVAAKAQTLWAMARNLVPGIIESLHNFQVVLRAVTEGRAPKEHVHIALAHTYQRLATADFSRDILQNAARKSLVMPIDGVRWSDWGRPERIWETLSFLGVQPTMPVHGWRCPQSRNAHGFRDRSESELAPSTSWSKLANTP